MTQDAGSDYTELGLQRHLLHVLLSLSVDTRSRPQVMMAMKVIYYEGILEIPVRVGKWNWEGKENPVRVQCQVQCNAGDFGWILQGTLKTM